MGKAGAMYSVGLVLALAAFAIWEVQYRPLDHIEQHEITVNHHRKDSEYFAIIDNPAVPDAKKADALLSLAIGHARIAFPVARVWIHSNSLELSKAAIRTLRFSSEPEDEALLLSKYLDSPMGADTAKLRQILVNSLADKPRAIESLYVILALPDTTKPAKATLFGAVYRKESRLARKAAVMQQLKELVAESHGDNKQEAVFVLASLRPRDGDLLKVLRRSIETGEAGLAPYAIRHLAKLRDPWMVYRFRGLLASRDRDVQASSIQVLPLLCPPHVIADLTKIYNTTNDPRLRRLVMSAVAHYTSQEAKAFIPAALDSPKLTPGESQGLRNKVAQIQASGGPWCATD